MKKSYLLVGLFALGMVGCGQNPEIGTVEPELSGTMEELAPSAQKTRLQEVGLEYVNAIKTEAHENLVDVAAFIDEKYGDYDIDEDYLDNLEKLYKETGYDEDYHAVARRSNPVKAIRELMAISLNAAQKGAMLSKSAEHIYTSTLKAGLKDLYGGFKPDTKYGVWAYDKNITDRLEVEFTDDHNQTWVATLKGSKETARIHVTVYDKNVEKHEYEGGPNDGTSTSGTYIYDDEYTIDVPKQITFTVKCNGNAVVDMTVNSDLAFEWDYNEYSEWTEYSEWYEDEWYYEGGYYGWSGYEDKYSYSINLDYTNLNIDAKLRVNGYEETLASTATKSGINASAGVKIDGKTLLKAEGALSADIDKFIKQVNEAANEDGESDIEVDATMIKEFTMYIDLMGKVQVVGKCDKFEDLHDAYMDIEEADDDDDFSKYERNVAQLNNAYSVSIHYDNTKTVQANVELEAYEHKADWDESYSYFDVRPVLVFAADDSRYSFEDYFTENSFSDLIEAVEDLADDFEKMFERYF